jgi:hypothetical protein
MKDYTLIIQGPLNRISLSNLDSYKQFAESIIICYWEGNDESILKDYNLEKCVLVKKPLPERNIFSWCTNHDTFVYQVNSVYYALCEVNTKYVIRTRSDEKYNLQALVDKFYQDDNKIVCGNVFFKQWGFINYHMGDHLFVGQTSFLRDAYKRAIHDDNRYRDSHCPEAIMAFAILDSYGLTRTRENFIKVFDVVDSNLMKPFIAQWKHAGVTYTDFVDGNSIIRNMGEL